MLAEKPAARHCPGRRRTCLLLTVRIVLRKLPVLRLSSVAISFLCNPKSIDLLEQIPQLPSPEMVTVHLLLRPFFVLRPAPEPRQAMTKAFWK
jgi:hypothetical protein